MGRAARKDGIIAGARAAGEGPRAAGSRQMRVARETDTRHSPACAVGARTSDAPGTLLAQGYSRLSHGANRRPHASSVTDVHPRSSSTTDPPRPDCARGRLAPRSNGILVVRGFLDGFVIHAGRGSGRASGCALRCSRLGWDCRSSSTWAAARRARPHTSATRPGSGRCHWPACSPCGSTITSATSPAR